MDETTSRFSCPACGQRFHWHPEYAGRLVACKCGARFRASLGGTDVLENRPPPMAVERISATADDDLLPQAGPLDETAVAQLTPGAATAVAAPPRRRPIATNLPPRAGRSIRDMASDEEETGAFRDWIAPLGLLALGGAARFSQVLYYADGEKLTRAKAIVLWACELLLGGAAMLGGALAVAAVMSVNFGPPARAVLKLMAIWLVAAAAACFLAKLDAEPMNLRGIVLGFHAVLLIYFAGVAWLFKLDLQEALITAAAVTVVQGLLLFGVAQSMSPDAARALFFG